MRRGDLAEVRSKIGLQFQNFALFDFLDVAGNVGYALEHGRGAASAEVSEAVGRALFDVGLSGAETSHPSDLSGGMRRRVAIARVMAARPEIAIFDDPVAGLDPVNSARVMQLLRDFRDQTGCLVVVATHDLERLLPLAPRTVALFGGRVLYDGPTGQIESCLLYTSPSPRDRG